MDLPSILKNENVCIIDTEYNNIRSDKATKMWCASVIDYQSKEVFRFHPDEEGEKQCHYTFGEELVEKLNEYDYYVGHNYIGAEYYVLKNLIGFETPLDQIIDTLVISRTQRPVSPYMERHAALKRQGLDTRLGGHSLAKWGERLGCNKIDFDNFSEFTFEQLDYCVQDTKVNLKVLDYLAKEFEILGFTGQCLEVEHSSHFILTQQMVNGFKCDRAMANSLLKETNQLIEDYTNELHKVFPEKKVLFDVYTPRFKKDGDMTAASKKKLLKTIHEQNEDGTYNLYTMQTFNPNSPKQVGERLIDIGWNPRIFTATGQPSTKKEVLGEAIDFLAVKVPEVEVLRKYNIVTHRNGLAKEWLELSEEDGRVHGSMIHINPWTHRSSHRAPNMGNIPKVSSDKEGKPQKGFEGNFGWECRSCFTVPEGKVLVGADASGIQLRALAHYINDSEYIKEVCEGDVHTTNMHAAGITEGYLGMSPRDVAKRFIYAWLLGAGDEKTGSIVGVKEHEYEALFAEAENEFKWNRWRHSRGDSKSNKYDNLLYYVTDKLRSEGRKADRATAAVILKGYFTKKKFLDNTPALKHFKEVIIPQAARDGYMVGLDGRIIHVPSEHLAMGAYLQGFEATVMKWATKFCHEDLNDKKAPFLQVSYVHDELEFETYPEYGEIVGQAVVDGIEKAGEFLNSRCPLTGEFHVGKTWADVH